MQFPPAPAAAPALPADPSGSHKPPPVEKSTAPPAATQPLVNLTAESSALILRQLFDIQTVIRLSQPEKMKAYRSLSLALCGNPASAAVVAQALDALLVDPNTINSVKIGLKWQRRRGEN